MKNLFDLTGRAAVVTGSAQGMGRAMAIALAEAGADLVLLDRREAGIAATAHSIRQLGRKALPITGDVTDTDQGWGRRRRWRWRISAPRSTTW
jgi:7-alpha-hydroxysteroid dehydrogenase